MQKLLYNDMDPPPPPFFLHHYIRIALTIVLQNYPHWLGIKNQWSTLATSTSWWTVLLMNLWANAALRSQKQWGLLGTGSPGRPPQFSHSSWALRDRVSMLLYGHRTAASTFTQLLGSEWTYQVSISLYKGKKRRRKQTDETPTSCKTI